MSNRWIFFPSAVSTGSNWTDYMSSNSGVGYWIVAAGSAPTGQISGPTGGDSSTAWTKIRLSSGAAAGTTQSGTVVSSCTNQWARGVQGGHVQFSNPYDYLAIGYPAGSGPSGTSTKATAPGWCVLEREQTAGTGTANRLSYIPIEGQDGLTSNPWVCGTPSWNSLGYSNHILFFFNNYSSGDVSNWTVWDGTTTP